MFSGSDMVGNILLFTWFKKSSFFKVIRNKIQNTKDQIKNPKIGVTATKITDEYNLKELSMGMSHDYKIALECGATMIRLGRILFN